MTDTKTLEIGFVYTESMTNPARAAEVFLEMRDMGATAVCFHAYEQDLHRWPKDVPRIHEAAARAGLRRYVSLARLGGMMAGLYSVPDVYTYLHPECRVTPAATPGPRSTLGLSAHMACVNDPGFRQYALEYVGKTIGALAPEGFVIDEPQGLIRTVVCLCARCVEAQRPDETKEDAQRRFRVDFLSELCRKARERSPRIRTTVVAAIGTEDRERFELFARVRGLDAIGVEPYWALVDKDLEWLDTTCRMAVQRVRGVGRELDVWALNFALSSEHQAEIPEAYQIIAAARPDAIWSYWWWRGNDDPAAVMRLTREAHASIRR
jgi:hypothetical protein